MSARPLLESVNYSSHYDATYSTGGDGGPTLPLDDIDRSIVEKRLLRKLDFRMAFLVLVYIMNIMDRYNVAAARLRGFEEDLGMTGNQFNTLISILYLGYLFMQAPSWLFFVEGALTIAVALSAIWILPDFPSTPSVWLSPDEQILAKRRMEEEVVAIVHESKPEGNFSGLVEALMDWRVWWLGVALHLMVCSQSFTMFFPTISATMGYSATTSLLLCAPPWILGTATLFVIARHSDVTGDRFWYIVCPQLVSIIGYMIAISTMNTGMRYLSLFFMTQSPAAFVVCLAWITNIFSQSQSKRAAAIALINTISSTGFISSSYIWPSSWGPSYVNSYLICISATVMSIAMCWILRQHLSLCNEAAEAEEKVLGLPEGFRYLL
ncbi:major facilitator superfamily domain-containing protein [Suillus cothurnatus]|nr:major facilitator superfamily domain-containing protein [Suillus cothurnatus]